MYPVPSRCALAFAGELSARHSRCWRFRGLQVHHCYDLLSCSPPLQETFTSGLSTVRSPSPLPDITTVATGQAPPAGLTPAGPTTSVAAQLPLLRDLAVYLVMDLSRDADSAGLRDRLQPRGDIDAIAVDARRVVDHVAEVEADAEQHAPCRLHARIALSHR